MVILRFFLLALVVVSVSSGIDCSSKDRCFGEPHSCDPVSDCQSLIQFDDSGNLVLHLRNITDINEYAAFPIKRYPDETIEFMLCVPLQQKSSRVRAELDGFVLSTDEESLLSEKYRYASILVSLTPITSQDYSRCYFDSFHLPENFETQSSFTVSRGNIDGLTIINDGVLLHPINLDLDFEDDSEEVDVLSTVYFLGSLVQEETVKSNGWWRSVRSPTDTNVDSQNDIEDEKRKNSIEMNTGSSTTRKDPTMLAETSRTANGAIDQVTSQSHERADNSEALVVVSVSSEIDCSSKDRCFGEPHSCDPVSDCQSFIQFDDSGNLVLHLRNITDINEYAAFPIKRYPDETIEFMLCVPLQQKSLPSWMASFFLLMSRIFIAFQILVSLTPTTSQDYSRCYFDSFHLPENFETQSSFTVSRGNIDGLTIINEGVLLHPINPDLDFEDDSEEVDVFSTVYFLGSPVQEETVESNGWWRSVRSLSDTNVDSQIDIEDEKRKNSIEMNTGSSTTRKDPPMLAETSQPAIDAIDRVTSQSQERLDSGEALVVVPVSSEIDCSSKDRCFGEPHSCDPVSDCQSIIQFDGSGNLVLHLTDINEYAAFPIKRYPDETIEFMLCVPLQQKSLRVRAELDGFVLSTDEILVSLTPTTPQDYSRCYFDSFYLLENFETQSSFTVSRGNIEGLTIINDGVHLHPINLNLDFEDDSEEVDVFSTVYFLGSPVQEETVKSNGWWRSVRSPSDTSVDSQNDIEDEKRENSIEMNTGSSTTRKDPPMLAETSQPAIDAIDRVTSRSQERLDNSEAKSISLVFNSSFSMESNEQQLIREFFGHNQKQGKRANSDTAKSIAGAVGLVSLFAMMRASTEEEIEADRQRNAPYTEVLVDRTPASQQSPSTSPAEAFSPPTSPTAPKPASASSSSSHTPTSSSSEESDNDVIFVKTVFTSNPKSPAPTPKKRASTSTASSGPSQKSARKL